MRKRQRSTPASSAKRESSAASDPEHARTLVVNTIVVMEIFYLFSVRYLRLGSLTWQGVLGTLAVLIGVGAIVLLQLACTYMPAFKLLFETRSVGLRDGTVVLFVGAALFAVLEGEKHLLRKIASRSGPGRVLPAEAI